jgi:hypothetical protein
LYEPVHANAARKHQAQPQLLSCSSHLVSQELHSLPLQHGLLALHIGTRDALQDTRHKGDRHAEHLVQANVVVVVVFMPLLVLLLVLLLKLLTTPLFLS